MEKNTEYRTEQGIKQDRIGYRIENAEYRIE